MSKHEQYTDPHDLQPDLLCVPWDCSSSTALLEVTSYFHTNRSSYIVFPLQQPYVGAKKIGAGASYIYYRPSQNWNQLGPRFKLIVSSKHPVLHVYYGVSIVLSSIFYPKLIFIIVT